MNGSSNKQVTDFLRWLADSQKNNSIATARDFPIDSQWLQTPSLWDQAKHWGFVSIDLAYEPRSLAVSPGRGTVAVGTKAGEICLACWIPERQVWDESIISRDEVCGTTTTPQAIRGLVILDESHIVAAWGNGGFSIVRLDPGGVKKNVFRLAPYDLPTVRDSASETDLSTLGFEAAGDLPHSAQLEEWRAGAARFSRIIPLNDPDHLLPATGDLILGISRDATLHVLERVGEHAYDRRRGKLEDLVPDWQEKNWGRLVDGVWAQGKLWLLSLHGHLVRYSLEVPGKLSSLTYKGDIHLAPPQAAAVFRRIDACEAGLAVLAEESVTFLWFGTLSQPADIKPVWFRVASAMDCSVTLPYPTRPIDDKNPVWILVSTNEPGLRWIAWTREGWPRAASANFILAGGGSVLYVATGRTGTEVPFVACGTRDHKLVVASILDRWACEEEVDLQVERMLLAGASLDEEKERLLEAGEGVRWWCLLKRLYRDFNSNQGSRVLDSFSVSELLGTVDASNLRHLASSLVRRRRKSTVPGAEFLLTDWVLRLLNKANQIGPGVDQEIARLLCEELQRHEDEKPLGSHEQALVRFLRKWVVYGHTYTEKSTGLLKVSRWNSECNRNLDSLVYLTQLMRRRADLLWALSPPTGPWRSTIWSLATERSGDFAIASFSDGTLCAVSGDGRMVPWSAKGTEEALKNRNLRLSVDGFCLERTDREAFDQKYHHGPYARSLWLRPLSENPDPEGEYLLVFCPKGWRPRDLSSEVGEPGAANPHQVYALHLRLFRSQPGGGVAGIQILAVDSSVVQGELYSLCEIESHVDGTMLQFILVAGTSGSWLSKQGHSLRPFIELDVRLAAESISIKPIEVEIKRFVEGERSALRQTPETVYNPCWSLAPSLGTGGADTWIWAGFQDGFVRGYRRQSKSGGGAEWTEGGEPKTSRGIQLTGAVWRLLEFESGGRRLLAFGTGDGVIGAVMVDDLLKKPAGDPVLFPIHSREASPICALLGYTDWENGIPRPFLMAVTQEGTCCIFSLDCIRWEIPMSEGATVAPLRRASLFHHAGRRVDRFWMDQPVRAMVWIGDSHLDSRAGEAMKSPEFLVGTAEGQILRYQLAFPTYSERRREEALVMRGLMSANRNGRPVSRIVPPGSLCDESTWVHLWLRALHAGDTLLGFSVWEELRQAGEGLWHEGLEAKVDEHAAHFRIFRDALERLEPETYQRRPFSKEPAKGLWSETGRIASAIAWRALLYQQPDKDALPLVRRRLQSYYELNVLASDLCNRWIGVEQALESSVLIRSFNSFFDWTAVILIASDQKPEEEAEKIRDFLIYTLIQRRLNFPDPIVPQETLRAINVAILRAIINSRTNAIEPRPLRMVSSAKKSSPSEGVSGFFVVMTMVGDLWERLARSLSLADPLVTEILRFFSLSLLLVPDSALITGQVVSESRFTEGGIGLAGLIIQRARIIRDEVKELAGEKEQMKLSLDEGLARFEAYIQEKPKFSLAESQIPVQSTEGRDREDEPKDDPSGQPWRFLAVRARKLIAEGRGKLGDFSEDSVLVEQYRVLQVTAWLSELNRPSLPEAELANWFTREEACKNKKITSDELKAWLENFQEPLHWLLSPKLPPKFFTHSWEYLRRLALARQDIRYLAQLTDVTSPDKEWSQGRKRTVQEAIEVCELVLDQLSKEYLFQPQRSQYRQVVLHWRDQLVRRGGEAITVLDVLDKFNRHGYRTSADQLMDKIVDLALQVAPVSFLEKIDDEEWKPTLEGPLRLLLRQRLGGYPLVRRVFESAEIIVERTHLAGALLAVARDSVGKPGVLGRRSLASRDVSMQEVRASLEEAARRMGIRGEEVLKWDAGLADEKVPGSRAIWDLIAQEAATNISKYSLIDTQAESKPERIEMTARAQKDAKGRLYILIAANVPYIWCKGEGETKYKGMAPDEVVMKLRERISHFKEPRVRGQSDEEGAGLGLYMTEQIADLCGMETEIELFKPDWSVHLLRRLPAEDQRSSPLCLCLSWRR